MGTTLASETSQPEQIRAAPPVEVSVVIPCLNEANSLALCVDKAVKAFRASGLSGEVIVADNGSTDGSIQIAQEHGARVVRVAERGYGSALRAGIGAARGPFIVMGDADDSYDFSDVPRFVEMLRQGYDVVMGNRFRGGIKPQAMPWHHKYIGNPVLSALLNLFFHAGIGDSHCGMRGFTRAVYDRMDLRSTGMEFASEFVIKAAQLDARITEIPVTLWPEARAAATPAELSRRLAASALHAALCTELAFSVAGRDILGGGLVSGFLAAAWTAPDFASRDFGYSHHDFRCDFHFARGADSFHRIFREGLQLRGASRPEPGVA